jgi:hypothetical protein
MIRLSQAMELRHNLLRLWKSEAVGPFDFEAFGNANTSARSMRRLPGIYHKILIR